MRIAQVEPLGGSKTREGEGFGDTCLFILHDPVYPKTFGDCFVHGVTWVQGTRRILKHELCATTIGLEFLAAVSQGSAIDEHLARGGALQAQERARKGCLAAATLADECHDLAVAQCQVDTVDGPRCTAAATPAEGNF